MAVNDGISQERSQLSAAKQTLLEKRLRGELIRKTGDQKIPRRTGTGPGPLSFAQQRLWFLEQLVGKSFAYNIPFGFRLAGQLNVVALERSINEIVRRHEALRTSFTTMDGQPVKVVAPILTIPLHINDLRDLPKGERDVEVQRLALEDARRLFDLAQCPLFRISLLWLDEEKYVLLMTIHHIIFDGWSVGVFMKELSTFYEAFSAGKSSPLPDLPIQYDDFAQWQREWLRGEVLERQLSYWKSQLSGSLSTLELPTDRPRPVRYTFQGAVHSFHLPKPLSDAVKKLSQQEGCTPFMLLLATFKILLFRYSMQADIISGSPVANRHHSELEGLIGFFVNMLVLRTDLSGDSTFREMLGRVRKMALDAQAHQDMPFDLLVEEIQPERDLSRQPLFQVVFALQNAPMQPPEFPGITLEPLNIHNGTAKFDLSLEMIDTEQGLTTTFEYNTHLFNAETITRMAGHFRTLLEGIIATPNQQISELPILTEAEWHQILAEWNDTDADYPKDKCVHELFEAQVEKAPNAVAVVSPACQLSTINHQSSIHLTYQELNRRVNQLAHHLQKLGIEAEMSVGICVERSVEMIVGILGILKAGAVYVPLDPTYPNVRLNFMLEDSQASVVLTQKKLASLFSEDQAIIICLDTDWELVAQEREENPSSSVRPQNQAYVMYTSGSTGNPKGVIIEHKNVVAFLYAFEQVAPFEVPLSGTSVCSYSFDVSIWEIFSTLCFGGTLHILPSEIFVSPKSFAMYLVNHHITSTYIPPSLLSDVIGIFEGLHTPIELHRILVGVEPIKQGLLQRLRKLSKQIRIVNGYGPTETTICATFFNFLQAKEPDRRTPIGTPGAGYNVYLLDSLLQPVPIGVPGELHISGVGLARGYLNRPELTKEKFIPNPFSNNPEERLYKTGDLARYLPDGNIEFIGRIDNQLKIRGFRIELGEIETVLTKHPDIREVIVIARETPSGDKQLAAYFVPHQKKKITVNELRDFLKKQLPNYMIPATFTFLDALPLTPNGKVDRRALPEPEITRPNELLEAFVAPQTPAEKTMADIWSSLLHINRIGVHDNFFELGGHSLLAVQLVSEIQKSFQVEFPLWKLFESPTIAELVRAMQEEQWQGVPKAVLDAPVKDVHAETILDDSIRPETLSTVSISDPAAIFLTGATGFLGAFLLHELLQQTRADIYCLVRPADDEKEGTRIQDNLKRYLLWHEQLASRIVPVPGDLSQPLLGLSPEKFDKMAQRIDVIYHGGAMVNYLYSYSVLKPANVLGTQEILRLASHCKVKPVHYISTLSVFPIVSQDKTKSRSQDMPESIREDTPLEHFENLRIGYSQTKWVAEKLLATAHSRGIPVSIYRPSRITGHSQTGIWNTNDFICRMLKSCIQIGSVPQEPIVQENWTPVDYVSQAIVHLSQQESSWGQSFHLVSPKSVCWDDLVDWIEAFGYPLRKLPYTQWRATLHECPEENPLSSLLPMFQDLEPIADPPHFSCQNTLAGLEGTSITCPPVDTVLLHTYFAYFLRSHFLEPPQVRS